MTKFDYIKEKLTYVHSKVTIGKTFNMQDINIKAEDMFMHILNDIYGWELKNANKIKDNFPTVDLIDTKNDKLIQVTSSISTTKINKTLSGMEKFKVDNDLKKYVDYDLIFLYIVKDKKDFTSSFLEKNNLTQKNFLDIVDLLKTIKGNIDLENSVYQTLKRIFIDKQKFIRQDSFIKKTRNDLGSRIKEIQLNKQEVNIDSFENELKEKSLILADNYFYLSYTTKQVDEVKSKEYFEKAVLYNSDYLSYAHSLFNQLFDNLNTFIEKKEKVFPNIKVSEYSIQYSIGVIEKYIFQKKYIEAIDLALVTLEKIKTSEKKLYNEAILRFKLGIAYSEEDDRVNGESEFIKSIDLYSQIIKNEPNYFNKLIIVVSEMSRFYKNRLNIHEDMIEIYNDIEMNGLLSDKNELSNLQNNFAILSEEFSKYNFAETLYENAISNKDNRELKNIYYNFYLFYKKNTKLLYAKKILYSLVLEDNRYALEYYDLLVVLLENYDKKSHINKIIDICKEIDTLNTKYQLSYYSNRVCKKYEEILEIKKLHGDAVKYLKSLDNKNLNEKVETVFVLQNSKLHQYFSDFYSKKLAFKDINFSETTMYKMMTFVLGIAFISVSILAFI